MQPRRAGAQLKTALKRSVVKTALRTYPTSVLLEISLDWKSGRSHRSGNLETLSGRVHAAEDLEASLKYIQDVFSDYKDVGALSSFRGKAAEVGPGDNYGVAILLRAAGCTQVDLVDRFRPKRNAAYQARIYDEMMRRSPAVAALLAGADLQDDSRLPGLRAISGPDAAAETFFGEARGYDFIVSRAVMEHLYDPMQAIAEMSAALNPGGMLLHKVDLRDHGLFSDRYYELKWLETPGRLHWYMTHHRGRPNRVLVHRYRLAMEALGLEHRFLVTRLAGVGDITPHLPYEEIDEPVRATSEAFVLQHRDHFSRELRHLPVKDLAVAGFFLVARKEAVL